MTAGRKTRSSQLGNLRNVENPRIWYRPSSAFAWMSRIVSVVQMWDRPSV